MTVAPDPLPEAQGENQSPRNLIARGNALARAGRLIDAAELYRAVLSANPESFEAHANLGGILVALGRFACAEPHLQQALALHPEQAPLHQSLGVAFAEQGRALEAEASFCRSAELAPDNPDIRHHLGSALYRLQRYDEAKAQYRRALDVAPNHSGALNGLAQLARRHQRFAEAEELYRRVLASCPTDTAALYGLGHCLANAGRVAEACESMERAIALRPDYIDAYYRLALLGRKDAAGKWLAQLEKLATRIESSPERQQVPYWFTLGRWREDMRHFDAAFAAYAEGNRVVRRWHRLDEYATRQEPLDARFNRRIAATFTAATLRAAPRAKTRDARVPIFIIGMPRSGTTLVEEILAAHPAVHGGGEMRHLPDTLREIFGFDESAGCIAYPEIVPSLTADALHNASAAYLERAWQQAPGASHITDKLAGNFLHAGMIHLALPQAKIIHVVRDPLDACFSCFANVFERGSVAYTYDLDTLGRHCARYLELMRHWRRVLPERAVLDVRYEELVADTELHVRRLLAHIGLPWDPQCLAFHSHRRAVNTVSLGQVRQPIYRSSVARWEHFRVHLGPLLDAVGAYR
ncbi:MAG: tetratricopeptide repeat-containing sulfotransferase family protein [Rhodanobacteraceae bacterium]